MACAARAPGLVSTLLAAMVQEHERAAGAWHAEWRPLGDLLVTVGSAAAWLRACLDNLQVDGPKMLANLRLTGGLLLSERVAAALAPALGRQPAEALVAQACRAAAQDGRPLLEALSAEPAIGTRLSPPQLAALLDPTSYLGSSDTFVDRALAAHRERREQGARR